MRKGALHSQRNEFIFSFSSSFHEKGCITSAMKQVHLFIFIHISWENMHYMNKETIHFSFSSSFHEKACITSTKKGVHLLIFILISWESVHYMHKETSTSFHPHFLRKCALCAKKNGFIFSFSPSFQEKMRITWGRMLSMGNCVSYLRHFQFSLVSWSEYI
jgi:hypothetical protein